MATHRNAPRASSAGPSSGSIRGLLSLVLLATTTCDHEPLVPSCEVFYGVGALEGHVRVAGEPIAEAVGARMLDSPGLLVAKTRSDSTGWYRLDLPTGAYHIELDPSSGGYTSSSYRDTVHVGPGVRHYDILWGKLTVQVAMPAIAEGRYFDCRLESTTGGSSERASARATNGSLDFHLSELVPDVYRIRMSSNNGGSTWLPGTSSPSAADRVTVTGDRPLTYQAALDHYATISGSVRGSWQEAGVWSPQVAAYTPAGGVGQTSTESDGSFTLELLTARAVRLQVYLGSVGQWIGGDAFETATVFTPEPGQNLSGVTWTESGILCRLGGPGSRVSYRADVVVRDATGKTFQPNNYDDNPIAICNLRPGRYWLYVYGTCNETEPWASQWYDGAESLQAATPIDVAAGQLARITLTLVEGGKIEGRLLAADGLPVSGGTVALYDRDGVSLCDGWPYRPGGTFSFLGLANGDYYLATQTSRGSWWYPGTTSIASARVIEIRNHATVTGIEWRLPGP